MNDELHLAAWELSTWAASINWNPGARNTRSWLAGLQERIEAVQRFGKPEGAGPTMKMLTLTEREAARQ